MQVILPALDGHIPPQMIRTFRAYLEFCYTARRSFLTDSHLDDLVDALKRFHQYRRIFLKKKDSGSESDDSDANESESNPTLTLPRQHSMVHYERLTKAFGAPNGLCSSITESKHIAAVKKPYRRSNHHDAIAQMLLNHQRLAKLAECRRIFKDQGLFDSTLLEQACAETDALRAQQLGDRLSPEIKAEQDNNSNIHGPALDSDTDIRSGTVSSSSEADALVGSHDLSIMDENDADGPTNLSQHSTSTTADEEASLSYDALTPNMDGPGDCSDTDTDTDELYSFEYQLEDVNIRRIIRSRESIDVRLGHAIGSDILNEGEKTDNENNHRDGVEDLENEKEDIEEEDDIGEEDDIDDDVPRASTHVFHARRSGE
jgi:hypothetical protein